MSIEYLDFSVDIPCESMLDCDQLAHWAFRHQCCGVTKYFCQKHGMAERVSMAQAVEFGYLMECVYCHERTDENPYNIIKI